MQNLFSVKAQVIFKATLQKLNTEITLVVYLRRFATPITSIHTVKRFLFSQASSIIVAVNGFSELGSNWVIESYDELIVNIAQYRNIIGSGFVNLPLCLKSRQGFINIHCKYDFCFQYCILAGYFRNVIQIRDKNILQKCKTYDEFLCREKKPFYQ